MVIITYKTKKWLMLNKALILMMLSQRVRFNCWMEHNQVQSSIINQYVIYSNTGSVHTNSIYLQDIPDGAGSSNDVRLMTEHQSYENIHLHIPDLKNFDGYGGRAKSEIMVTSTEQHITGRKTFFDINVLKPDNDDQAANKKYVDDSGKKNTIT